MIGLESRTLQSKRLTYRLLDAAEFINMYRIKRNTVGKNV